jgi:hypothetical protein
MYLLYQCMQQKATERQTQTSLRARTRPRGPSGARCSNSPRGTRRGASRPCSTGARQRISTLHTHTTNLNCSPKHSLSSTLIRWNLTESVHALQTNTLQRLYTRETEGR